MRQEGYQNERSIYRSLMIIRYKKRHDQKEVTDHGEQKLRRVFCETLKSLSEAKMKSKM
jgi:hypothetical protein